MSYVEQFISSLQKIFIVRNLKLSLSDENLRGKVFLECSTGWKPENWFSKTKNRMQVSDWTISGYPPRGLRAEFIFVSDRKILENFCHEKLYK